MKKFSFLLSLSILIIHSQAQTNSEKIEHLVDSIVNSQIAKDQPGAAIGVLVDGQPVFMKGYGMSNLDFEIPVSVSTKFNLASCSKQFTAACIMQLQAEGKLDLDCRIVFQNMWGFLRK